ncbi:phage tail protein [Novosphingobium humi]|uniref:Phage tail protein n=1 Tax=Novosphingobium humi TaxID=2282397 RepID=A0ABY7U171_9SPHN|nr:phage tail protein [Novosphingobium humi]WCT78870.1 phage tail protein [Novosphingobium humi]
MKVLKGAAQIIGAISAVAAVVAGPSLLGVAFAANAMLMGAIASSIKDPSPSSGGSQTKWKADPYAGLPYVMGRTLVSGNIVAKLLRGSNNAFQALVTVLSIGPVHAYEASYMNKTTMTWMVRPPLSSDGVAEAANGYRGYIWEQRTLGLCPEAYAPGQTEGFAGWTSEHKLSGLASVFNVFWYNSKDSNTLTAIPSPAWLIEGVLVYDPRLDSTYPGGSGPCRALDESTYVYSEDPHLHALTWCLGRWQNGVRVAGLGAPISRINVASFVEGANLNDARGWKLGGQVYTRPDTPWNSLKAMLQAGGAQPAQPGGIITAINRAPRVSLATITHADIIGKCTFSGTQKRRNRPNGIIPQYRSEAHDWEMVSAQLVQVPDYVALDGGERTKEISYPLVQDVHQVAQLAAYDICDAREAGPGTIPLKPAWMNYAIGDCVTFQPQEGWSIKVMITGRQIDPNTGSITYTVRGETDAKHDFALGKTGVAPPMASLNYDLPPTDPAGEWTVNGTTLADNGAGIPALVIAGAVSITNAEAVQFDYRPYVSGAGGEDGWIASATVNPAATHHEITSVTPETIYEVSVRYRIRGVWGNRGILGPVAAGKLYPAGYLRQLIASSYTSPSENLATAHDAGSSVLVSITDHTRVYPDREVYISGVAPITGLAFNTTYYLYYDDADRSGGAVEVHATPDLATAAMSDGHPARHQLGIIITGASGAGDMHGGGVEPVYQVSTRIKTLAADVAFNANTLMAYQYNTQQLRDYVDGKLFVDGVAVNTVIVQERSERIEAEAALAQTISLIGARNASSSAFILNFDSVQASTTGETLATIITSMNAANAATSASITELRSIVLDPSGGATAKAVFQLNASGHVVGYEATNDGSVGSLVFSFDSFILLNPITGTSIFRAEGGRVKMSAVEVDTLKVNTAIVPKLLSSTTVFNGNDSDQTVMSTSIVMPVAGYVVVTGSLSQGFSVVPRGWTFTLYINGTQVWVGSGTYPGDVLSAVGSKYCEAGTVTIQMIWSGNPAVRVISQNYVIQGFPNTQ